MDLITNPEENADIANEDAAAQKLHAHVVQAIWTKSQLGKGKLRAIWDACASPGEKSLDREAFVAGMWQIDEELRKAQVARDICNRSKSKSNKRTNVKKPPPMEDLLL